MLKIKFTFFALFLILITSSNVFAQKYVQISTEKQQESKDIIIYEFFLYVCAHCYNQERTMDRWVADLEMDSNVVNLLVAISAS